MVYMAGARESLQEQYADTASKLHDFQMLVDPAPDSETGGIGCVEPHAVDLFDPWALPADEGAQAQSRQPGQRQRETDVARGNRMGGTQGETDRAAIDSQRRD